MANHSVTAGQVGVHEKTLVANTADVVTFAEDLSEVQILTDGVANIYVTFGAASTPTVKGQACRRVPAVAGSAVFRVRTTGNTVVKLISDGTPVYSVSRVHD